MIAVWFRARKSGQRPGTKMRRARREFRELKVPLPCAPMGLRGAAEPGTILRRRRILLCCGRVVACAANRCNVADASEPLLRKQAICHAELDHGLLNTSQVSARLAIHCATVHTVRRTC